MSSKFQEASAKLVDRLLGQMGGSLKPLGFLVDGRSVLWLPSDPFALYVQFLTVQHSSSSSSVARKDFRDCVARENRVRSTSDRLISSSDARHCCVWGCTFEADDSDHGFELAHFTSAEHLHSHNSSFHSYSGETNNSVRLGGSGFSRVASIDGLKNLISGLTSAACARSAQLAGKAKKTISTALVDPSGERIVCSPSRYDFHLSLDNLFEAAGGLDEAVLLLFNIALLFDVEGCSVRMTEGAHKSFHSIMSKDGPRGGVLPAFSCCSCSDSREIVSITNRECLQCSLCNLDAEEVLQVNTMERETESGRGEMEYMEQPTYSYRGIGCAIAGNILGPRPDDFATKNGGFLSYAKRLLLLIASKIPPHLRTTYDLVDSINAVGDLSKRMWKTDGGSDFRRFVMQSSSVQMLTQAFVVLLASFQKSKLPLWWSGEAGWSSSAFVLLHSSSKASLILHMLLCDIALVEYLEIAPEETPLRNLDITGVSVGNFKGITVEAKMKLLLEAADSMSIPRFTGIHESFCSICEDGGSLLCCEFCPGVVHSTCCSPPVPELDHWCCASCTASLMELGFVLPFSKNNTSGAPGVSGMAE